MNCPTPTCTAVLDQQAAGLYWCPFCRVHVGPASVLPERVVKRFDDGFDAYRKRGVKVVTVAAFKREHGLTDEQFERLVSE